MTNTSTYISKTNKWTFLLYTVVTIIIILLVKIGKVSYGMDIQNSLIPFIYIIVLLLVFFFRWITYKTKGKVHITFLLLSSVFMVMMMVYYFFQDSTYYHF